MKTDCTTFIHLGMPKTATTCFQNHLFSQHSRIHYFGKFYSEKFPAAVLPALVAKHLATHPLEPGDIREKSIREQLDYAAGNQLTPLLSGEGLAGGESARKQQQARLFKACFGECKIILFVREPVFFCKSWYAEMLKSFHIRDEEERRGWMKRIEGPPHYFDINEWLEMCWPTRSSPEHFLSYADTAEIYAKVFGKENVKIFIFEEFVRNPENFITTLCDHMGIDSKEGFDLINGKRANERITTEYIRRLREIEQSESLTRQFRSALPKERREMLDPKNQAGDKFKPELSAKWLKKINSVGDKQNRRLVKGWGLPLADYGYRL